MLIGDIVRRNARFYAGGDAVVVPGGVSRTWLALEERTNRLANAILALGVEPGDRIAVFAPNCAEYVELNFAGAKAGLPVAAVNTRLAAGELARYLLYVDASVAFVHADLGAQATFLDEVPSVRHIVGFGGPHAHALDLEQLVAAAAPDEPTCLVGEDDAYQLAATSGTTGVMKAAIVTHRNAIAGMLSFLAEQPTPAGGTFLQNTPMFFGPGGPAVLHPVLTKGGRSVVAPTFRPSEFLRLVEEYRVTNTNMVPTMLTMVLDDPSCRTRDVSSLRAITVGGSSVSRELLLRARAVFGDVFYPWYGLTETSSTGLVLRPSDQRPDGTPDQVRRLASLGKPHVNAKVRIVGEDGGDVPADGETPGEIWIGGEVVSPGYFRLPDETAAVRDGDWFKTGDVATVDEESFVTLVDRKKDIIITGGINVFSREVEEAIATHPGVSLVAVIGIPHERWGEAIHAVVVPRPGATVTPDEIIEHAGGSLAAYKKPRSVEIVDSVPIGSTGKILKRELRARYWDGGDSPSRR